MRVSDQVARQIANAAAPAEIWERMGGVRQHDYGRIAAATMAVVFNLHTPDGQLDLDAGARTLEEMARAKH